MDYSSDNTLTKTLTILMYIINYYLKSTSSTLVLWILIKPQTLLCCHHYKERLTTNIGS